ncbi:unnamed protein product [Microthlaspi erraticum]|uniref:DDT domain-containing protein n=1 Tax=Microthlaspi erraticum TaxID=1685480 RepID=A0A6D2HFY8_9BRAS|nr:unnamed protein product [Microthlaspi erraticum]
MQKDEGRSESDVEKDKNKVAGQIKKAKAGIDIPNEDTGNVLQFLEFYSAFQKVLKKGEAESIVAELFSPRRHMKRQQHSNVIQMMIQLLNLISADRNLKLSISQTDTIWFNFAGEILYKSGVLSGFFPPETFKKGVSEYEKMDASKRLKLLICICDESLGTKLMRDFIKKEFTKSETKRKEANQNATAARQKEKQLRQKMESDLGKAHMEETGAPLSVEEHRAIISRLQAEAEEAHDEMLAAKAMASRRCDAVRTEPILLNDDGSALWKLNCFEEEPKFLLQERGTFDDLPQNEKWLAFKREQKQEVEKYISEKRGKFIIL